MIENFPVIYLIDVYSKRCENVIVIVMLIENSPHLKLYIRTLIPNRRHQLQNNLGYQ